MHFLEVLLLQAELVPSITITIHQASLLYAFLSISIRSLMMHALCMYNYTMSVCA